MDTSIYNALFGAMTQNFRMDIIANNLANADTTGFKREQTSFKDVYARYWHDVVDWTPSIRQPALWPEPEQFAQARIGETYTDFSTGGIKHTGNPLDVAIQGEGFFKVQTPNGVRYSRAGSFGVDAEGNLINAQGFPVMAAGGNQIQIPPGATVSINENGEITAGNEVVGVLDVVGFNNMGALEREGRNNYKLKRGFNAQEQPAANFQLVQGALEVSNVSIVEEMVKMIDTQRVFESYQKIMTSTQDNDRKAINDIGTTR